MNWILLWLISLLKQPHGLFVSPKKHRTRLSQGLPDRVARSKSCGDSRDAPDKSGLPEKWLKFTEPEAVNAPQFVKRFEPPLQNKKTFPFKARIILGVL